MTKFKLTILLALVCLMFGLSCFGLGYRIGSKQAKSVPPVNIQHELESLEHRLDTLKVVNNTLIQKNDSIQVKIVKIKEEHEKTADIILSNDVESDYIFFTDYINSFRLMCSDFE